jgi:hypothetical protein
VRCSSRAARPGLAPDAKQSASRKREPHLLINPSGRGFIATAVFLDNEQYKSGRLARESC